MKCPWGLGVEEKGVSHRAPWTRISVIYICTASQKASLPFATGNCCHAGNNRGEEWVHFPSQGVSPWKSCSLCICACHRGGGFAQNGHQSPFSFLAVCSGYSWTIQTSFSPTWSGGIYNPMFPKVTNSCNSTSMKKKWHKGKPLTSRPPIPYFGHRRDCFLLNLIQT